MKYDFKLRSSKGFLTISGSLTESDSVPLKQLLISIITLERCHALQVNFDKVTFFSPSCKKALEQANGIAHERRTYFTIDADYNTNPQTVYQWINDRENCGPLNHKVNTLH